MSENRLPKLRDVDLHSIVHQGRPSILLRDPLQLSERTAVIPRQLAPVLMLCDGTRDIEALRAAMAVRFGLRVGTSVLEQLLTTLDEALLLDNDRFATAREQALSEYRQVPFRQSALAGQSYPSDPDELRCLLRRYVEAVGNVRTDQDGARGLVSPHIDYARGGTVYASIWKRAMEAVRAAELIVLLGTDHFGGDGRLTLTRQHYATPFGVLPTAQAVVGTLAQAMGEEVAFADELHHRSEHSIELAAIWLHFIREGEACELVPILCGSFGHFIRGEASLDRDPVVNALLNTLRAAMADRRTMVVAAADLSHVGPAFGGRAQDWQARARLQVADDELIERMCAGDAQGFYAAIAREGDRRNVCGLPPIYLTLRLLSPTEGERVAYERCPADERGASLVSVCGILFR